MTAYERREHVLNTFNDVKKWWPDAKPSHTPGQLDGFMLEGGISMCLCETGWNIHFACTFRSKPIAHYIFNTDSGICICNLDFSITEEITDVRNILSDIIPSMMHKYDEDCNLVSVFECPNKPVRIDLDAEPVERLSPEEIAKRIIASFSNEDLDD
jgi:hypothetical protein